MLSGKASHIMKECRFCWMCRHLCPLGLATGKELYTPRAKALLLDMEQKGTAAMEDYAEEMFGCCLCGSCAFNCETGYEPPIFIREARRNIVANGMAPAYVMDVITAYLEKEEGGLDDSLKFGKADILVYTGTEGMLEGQEMAKDFCAVISKAGVAYTLFHEEPKDGNVLFDLIGETAEVKKIAKACADAINKSGAKQLVVLNPSSARMFKQEYPVWGLELLPEVVTATSFVETLINEGKLQIKQTKGTVTYHDPCRLARDLEETESARNIIRAMGYELKEMIQSRKITKCCGGVALNAHSPQMAKKTATGRLSDVDRIFVDTVVTACPGCQEMLQKGDGKAAVKDIFALLNEHI